MKIEDGVYKVIMELKTFTEAVQYCEDLGGYLLRMETEPEWDIIEKFIANSKFIMQFLKNVLPYGT